MHNFSKLAVAALLIGFAAPALAQGASSTSISVQQPWSRATPNGAKTGAAYMTIDNKSGTADKLTGASSDIADKVQIHQMKVENGIMQMREITDGLPIPAGGSVVFRPGGYHVMLIGLKKPLTAGKTFPLTLSFAKAGTISVTVPIQAMGASNMGANDMGATSATSNMSGMSSGKPGGMGKMEMK